MARQQVATTAASLLNAWTDADTAMQIVGTSLGLFGSGLLDPGPVLSRETPLRNALFDVLLSLVEGGAIELRATEDAGYAFRWRADYAVAAVSHGSGAIDLDAPSPYLAELARAQRERDDALGRAEFAEALATERERLLRLAEAQVQSQRAAPGPTAPREAKPPVDIDLTDHAIHDAPAPPPSRPEPPVPSAKAAPKVVKPAAVQEAPAPAATAAPTPVDWTEPPVKAAEPVEAITPEPVEPNAFEPDAIEPDDAAVVEPEPAPKKAAAKKAAPRKAVRKKPARKKAAPKKVAAAVPDPEPIGDPEPEADEPAEPESNDVIYLNAPPAAEADSRQPKWSGYTIDKPRSHLSSVDSLADQL